MVISPMATIVTTAEVIATTATATATTTMTDTKTSIVTTTIPETTIVQLSATDATENTGAKLKVYSKLRNPI